jgi:hypothetical protein
MSQFDQTLIGLRNGAVIQSLNKDLTELVAAVRDTEKAGALVLKVKVAPAAKGKGGADMVVIEADVKVNLPKPDLGKTFFFTDEEANLLVDNPKQMKLRPADEPEPQE